MPPEDLLGRFGPRVISQHPGPGRLPLWLALPCVLSDGQSLPFAGGDTQGEPVVGHATAKRRLHAVTISCTQGALPNLPNFQVEDLSLIDFAV